VDERQRRSHLRLLDSYLEVLETTQARGQRAVPQELFAGLRRDVPGVSASLSVSQSIDLIFREQERYLSGRGEGPVKKVGADAGGATLALPKRQARLLTETIRKQLRGDISLLLSTAHNRRAWAALGYSSWEDYVRLEFGLSRRRSYELLDHAQVMLTIRDAGHMRETPHIRPYTAGQLKPHLGEICETLLDRTSDVPPAQVTEVVDSVIQEWRIRCANERGIKRAMAAHAKPVSWLDEGADATDRLSTYDAARLEEVIRYLAHLPPLDADAVRELDLTEMVQFGALPSALKWLTQLRQLLQETARPLAIAGL
jgi:hypothetical protein